MMTQEIAETTPEVQEFLENIRRIPEILPMHEELSVALRSAMMQMQENKGFVDMLAPEDIGLMIRGARELRGFVANDKVSKRKNSSSAKKQQIASIAAELGALLK